MNPLPEFRVDPNKKKRAPKSCSCLAYTDAVLLLSILARRLSFFKQVSFFIGKAVVTDDTPIVNYTEYALVDVLPFKEKHEV